MRNRFSLLLAAATAIGAISASVLADIVHLKGGKEITGSVKRTDGGWRVTGADGKTTDVSEDDVESIEKVSSLSPDEQAKNQLEALRKLADRFTDARMGVERFKKFIADNPNTAAATEAKGDLAQWQERIDKGYVRIGKRWVNATERAKVAEQLVGLIDQARSLVKDAKVKESQAAIARLFDVDPDNAAGHYLSGILAYRQDQALQARKSFEAANAADPDHGPTLNNIAVVAWRQNQFGVAMSFYDKALLAAPASREILDNVAEALHALPPDFRRSDMAQKVLKRFTELDRQMAATMEKQKLYRWGATWIDADKLAELKKQQDAVKGKVDALKSQIEDARLKVVSLEQRIASNSRSMDSMAQSRVVTDAQGNRVVLPLPTDYYRLQRENVQLDNDRSEVIAQGRELVAREAELEKTVPQPTYHGTQQVMGVEGTPHALPAAPTTAPAKV